MIRLAGIGNAASVTETLAAVRDDDFYGTFTRKIAVAVRAAADRGVPPDLAAVAAELGADTHADELDALIVLANSADASINVAHHARIVREMGAKRRAVAASQKLIQAIAEGSVDGEARDLRAALDVMDSSGAGSGRRGPQRIEDLRDEANALAASPSIPCVVPGLNVGYRPGHIVIPAAYVGGGKTLYMRSETRAHAFAGRPVLFISAELSAIELAGILPGINGIKICDDTPRTTEGLIGEIEKWHGTLAEDVDTPVVLVDFLQRFRAEAQSGYRVVGEVAEALQTVTRRLGIITIAAAQLSRGSQTDDRPKLHHLREAGEIEQVGDLVILLAADGKGRMRVEVAKNRWGSAGHEIEVGYDWLTAEMRGLGEDAIFGELARAVVTYLQGCGGKAKVRELCRDLGHGGRGRHPSRQDIEAATSVGGMFRIEAGDAILMGS